MKHGLWLLLVVVLGLVGCEREVGAAPPARVDVVATQSSPKVVATPSNDQLPGLAQVAADERAAVIAVVQRIWAGGPFAYPGKDGSTFGNYEQLLPARPRGYYSEYTVPTPGERSRGARRIVAGRAAELYYTRDHYVTFVRLRP